MGVHVYDTHYKTNKTEIAESLRKHKCKKVKVKKSDLEKWERRIKRKTEWNKDYESQ